MIFSLAKEWISLKKKSTGNQRGKFITALGNFLFVAKIQAILDIERVRPQVWSVWWDTFLLDPMHPYNFQVKMRRWIHRFPTYRIMHSMQLVRYWWNESDLIKNSILPQLILFTLTYLTELMSIENDCTETADPPLAIPLNIRLANKK